MRCSLLFSRPFHVFDLFPPFPFLLPFLLPFPLLPFPLLPLFSLPFPSSYPFPFSLLLPPFSPFAFGPFPPSLSASWPWRRPAACACGYVRGEKAEREGREKAREGGRGRGREGRGRQRKRMVVAPHPHAVKAREEEATQAAMRKPAYLPYLASLAYLARFPTTPLFRY